MTRAIFVTGGGGFVGRRVLAVADDLGRPIVALGRAAAIAARPGEHVTVVRGDLTQPETYRQHLVQCDTVVHLAAATGRAPASEHFKVNAAATEALIAESRAAGVTRFLFVSSIAATFPDLRGYAYGLSKVRAEEAVRNSGLRYTIVRPAMILGPGSPLQMTLEKLALLPAIVLPGSGRARVQPIHVDDVARAIALIVRDDLFSNETYAIGGPDILTMEELLQKLRLARTGQRGRVVHVPLGLMRPPLRLAESLGLLSVLPTSAGQLSSFEFDGIAASNALQEQLAPGLIRQTAVPSRISGDAGDLLRAEARVLSRYLIGLDANEHVQDKYAEAHARLPSLHPANRFDALLISIAARGSWLAKIADTYSAALARDSVLRKKLVVLLAILETSAPFYRTIDTPVSRSLPAFAARAVWRAAMSFLAFWVGSVFLLPAQVLLSHRERSST